MKYANNVINVYIATNNAQFNYTENYKIMTRKVELYKAN